MQRQDKTYVATSKTYVATSKTHVATSKLSVRMPIVLQMQK